MLTVINDGTYGSDFSKGEIRLSLLRGAAYTAHPLGERIILPQNRFSPRIDQGERRYRFVLSGGEEVERMENISREAQAFHEPPYALSFFPDGKGDALPAGALLSGEGVQMTALRPARDGSGYIIRLFDATGHGAKAHLELPLLHAQADVILKPFEIVTLKVDSAGVVCETDLLA